jgi:pimeloyl-ACP methyl ester carboxylesterase
MKRTCRSVAQADPVTANVLLGAIVASLLAACGGSSSSPAGGAQTTVHIEAAAASTLPATMLPITATVQGDPAQQGVTWAISPATGAGTLSDADSRSVTYNAPDNPPASDLTVTITATAVADSAISDAITITVPANVVYTARMIPCPAEAAALNASCGTVDVPFDRRHVDRGTIPIYFERYAHTGPVLESAIVFRNGGPGNATRRTPALRLFGPLLDAHDLLLIDARGTGHSNAIDCPSLQGGWASWDVTAAECAAELGPAASFYGSVDIAKDTEAVRMALGYDLIDYYGLSWGGATVTAYATRFASHLRSIILDSPVAGPLLDESQFLWERFTAQSAPLTIALQCRYSPACSADHPDPAAEIVALVHSIRATPVEGEFIGTGGVPMQLRIDEHDLLVCMLGSGSAFFRNTGEYPAAAQALAQGDPLPLLRLRAEGWCPGPYDHGDPMQNSAGAGWATGCADMHHSFDWSKPVPDRLAEYDAAVAALPTGYFEPFTALAATNFQYGWGACLYFEKPTPTQPIVRSEADYPSTPTLVLGGDIDYWFPSAAVEAVAALYPGSTLINVADTGHVTAGWSQCARNLVSEFVSTLRIENPACAQVPETVWPAVGRFPLLAADARPADADPEGGNEIDVAERKVVTVAIAAMTDALQRGLTGGPTHGVGLRGGTFSRAWGSQLTLTLNDCAFTTDVKVSGLVTWAHSDIFGDGGFLPGPRPLTADLVVSGPGTAGGTLHVAGSWLSSDPDGYFRVTGTLGGKNVAVLVPEA